MANSITMASGAILTLLLAGPAFPQTLDRIIAVVDDELILESELTAQVEFFALNNRVDPNTPGLREQVLESMVSEKLIVAKAIEDSITVTDEEVRQQLEAVLQQRIQQVGSEARLEELYGMPISRIRREFRDEMRKNLIAERLQQERFGQATIGRHEVEEFYQIYKDSLPRVSEEVELAHIFRRPQASEDARTATRAKMQLLLDSIKAGADFSDIARRHSEDPGSATEGGDLGLVRRGLFVKEFESAVFSLSEGQMSGIIKTQFGLHVVQLLERRGDAVRARHILLKMERSQADDDSTIAFLGQLRQRAMEGEDFAELARKYSEDTETNLVGGQLGTFELENLDANLYDTVTPLKEGE
ncbi:MAG: peptidylprolyl isomerase, partial [Bacteroidetes bacterium]|nr:peptidylprolyl isomerase [Bacteroidota bacterium]